ncbi:hypothetical protein C2S51_026589 [Perilla frutescens var. frutescens]|nr:hypothetical protein C2S51_026589 [Perilla frutescens var. frutescens]
MGTEILQPQDLLAQRFHVAPPSFHRRKNFPANGNLANLIVNRRPGPVHNNSGHKKTSPKPDKKKSNDTKRVTHGGDARRKEGGVGPAMGQVTILRRGQSLGNIAVKLNGGDVSSATSKSPKAKPAAADDMAVLGTGRIGPNSPVMVPKQIRLSPPPLTDTYAGSAFSLSPSPRSLPLPSFFNKKQQDFVPINPFDDPATRDLRRLLRLD